jgi:hypothetical protein
MKSRDAGQLLLVPEAISIQPTIHGRRIHDWGIMVGLSDQCWEQTNAGKDRLSAVFPY